MIIRKAGIQDVKRISYLIHRNTEKVLDNNYSKEQIWAWKKANTPKAIENQLKQRVIFCAFEKDKLIGTIGLQKKEVLGLYVSYTQRGRGVGKKLHLYLEQFALKNNIAELELTSTPSAVEFYKNLGYEILHPVSIIVNDIEFQETRMIKKIH